MNEDVKSENVRIHSRADELIACLEGEIAKRDEELAACRVAVENCEVFRARIVELEHRCGVYGLELHNATERLQQAERQIKAIKAQEPDCDRSACGDFSPGPCDNPDCSARRDRMVGAPAAKAQGVALDGSQLAGLLEQVRLDDDEAKPHGSGATYWNNAVIACQVAIRDALAATVQQVSVPDGWRLVKVGIEGVQFGNAWFSHEGITGYTADQLNSGNCRITGRAYMDWLAAAPAAPAADAGIVDMYRHLQKVTPYRFKKIQDASITDGGDVMYFHKDRFDAALLADMAAHCAAKGWCDAYA